MKTLLILVLPLFITNVSAHHESVKPRTETDCKALLSYPSGAYCPKTTKDDKFVIRQFFKVSCNEFAEKKHLSVCSQSTSRTTGKMVEVKCIDIDDKDEEC